MSLPYGIQRVGFRKVPHVPTPTERMQQYRLRQPVQFANDSLPRREARNQYDSSPFESDDFLFPFADRRGF
jgi:hypothetical protein